MSIEQWSDLMFPEKGANDAHMWGSVKAVNGDGSYEVQLNASSTTTRCAAGCTAGVGDRVLVCIMANGRCVAVARLGGEGGGAETCVIQARSPETLDLTGESQQIVLTAAAGFGYSDAFELKDGSVVCKADGNVLVSAQVYISTGVAENDRIGVLLCRDDSIWPTYFRATGTYNALTLPPMYLSVKAGQVLMLKAYNITASRGVIEGTTSTRLVVQYFGSNVSASGGSGSSSGSGGGIAYETDPTVPSWAKQPSKPTYTASEVGADAKGAASSALAEAKAYADQQIAAIPTPDVSGQIGAHNVATDAHNDIRLFLQDLTERVNALADSDDTTLDQMSEVVAYIKGNRDLIEQVTTGKVSVADIIDNLTTNVSDRPLSAAQGVALKALIDAIEIPTAPTKVSAFENDAGYLTEVDKQEIISAVIASLPVYAGEVA